jgi:hypothetical protein
MLRPRRLRTPDAYQTIDPSPALVRGRSSSYANITFRDAFLEMAMTMEGKLTGAGASRLQGSPRRSHVAQELARWGAGSCRLASFLAVLCLLAAGAFTVLAPEALSQRLITLAFFGLPLGLAAYLMGWLIRWILIGASAIYDPVTSALWLILRLLASAGWRFLAWLATDHLPACLTNIIALLLVCRRTVERVTRSSIAFVLATVAAVVWAFGKVKRTGMQAASMLARLIRHCVRIARMRAQTVYRSLRIACVVTAAGLGTCRRAVAGLTGQIACALVWLLRLAISACIELALACEHATARLLVRTGRRFRKAWRLFIFTATFPVRLVAQILIRLIPSAA